MNVMCVSSVMPIVVECLLSGSGDVWVYIGFLSVCCEKRYG